MPFHKKKKRMKIKSSFSNLSKIHKEDMTRREKEFQRTKEELARLKKEQSIKDEKFPSEDEAERFARRNCFLPAIRIKLAIKTLQIRRIENSNLPDREKGKRIIALYPKDKCWKNFVISDSGYFS